MPSFKRRIANVLEAVSGNLIIPKYDIQQLQEVNHLRRLLEFTQADCIFDVGANEGQYATLIRNRVGFKGPILSYEPIPEVASRLKLRSQADPNWFIEPMALDAEGGMATFYVASSSEFSSLHRPAQDQPRLFAKSNRVEREVSVIRATLAAELPRWQKRLGFKRPFLKLDTQGNDLRIVRGAGDQLRSFVGIQSELSIKRLYEGGVHFGELLDEYRKYGFEISAFVANNDGHFPLLIEIDCILIRRNLVPSDFASAN